VNVHGGRHLGRHGRYACWRVAVEDFAARWDDSVGENSRSSGREIATLATGRFSEAELRIAVLAVALPFLPSAGRPVVLRHFYPPAPNRRQSGTAHTPGPSSSTSRPRVTTMPRRQASRAMPRPASVPSASASGRASVRWALARLGFNREEAIRRVKDEVDLAAGMRAEEVKRR
jgi:hypothetical protein